MKDSIRLRVEKDWFENEYQAFLTELGKNTPSQKLDSGDVNLTFELVSPGRYRVVNRNTGRLHNTELGIDWVM